MGKARLLIVEDDGDISNMLRIYFTSQGYDVDLAATQMRSKTRQCAAPDCARYYAARYWRLRGCRTLRMNTRTSLSPSSSAKDERSDRLQGLELGADDYITKPFDIEELKLRVQNAIAAERERPDPQSGCRLVHDRTSSAAIRQGWNSTSHQPL